MKTRIDSRGRFVIPSEVRRRAGLRAGTQVDVVIGDDGDVRLMPLLSPPRFEPVNGRWRATPTVPKSERTPVDILKGVEEAHDRGR